MDYNAFMHGIAPYGWAVTIAATFIVGRWLSHTLPKGFLFGLVAMVLAVVLTPIVGGIFVMACIVASHPAVLGVLAGDSAGAVSFFLESGTEAAALALPVGPLTVLIQRLQARRINKTARP